jgi:hypothetical protein
LTNGIHLLRTLCPDDPPEAAELLDSFDSTYISGRLRQQNPAQNHRRMGMSYQVEEIVVPALTHVVGSGITVDCGIMYVPNGWWKQVGYVLRPDGLLDFVLDSAIQQRNVQLQERLQNLCRDLTTGQKTIA